MALLPRPTYMASVDPYIDQPVIKVLTGLRRCGKSSLLSLIADELIHRGADQDHVIRLDFESLDLSPLTTADVLHTYLTERMTDSGRYHILLDEIQEVDGWPRVANSLFATRNVDLYLTGSNSRLLSSELATYIAGRYVAIEVDTLSFAEHMAFTTTLKGVTEDTGTAFTRFLRRGGFPGLYTAELSDDQHDKAVADIYASALIQDTIQRRNIRNVDMLRRIAAFALDNVGNPFSARSVSDYFKSQRRNVDPETALNYLDALCEAFLLTKVPRYDLQGRRLLTINEKYYAGDHSLIHAVLGYSDRHVPGILENIVAIELHRRGWRLAVGKAGEREVDFVATREGSVQYVQVTTSLRDQGVRDREMAPLLAQHDSWPKLILSLDQEAGGADHGIEHRWLPTWLLDD